MQRLPIGALARTSERWRGVQPGGASNFRTWQLLHHQEWSTKERTELSEEARRRFESIADLQRAAYTSFNDRRSYEWKLSIAIWTTEAVVLAGLVQPVKVGESFPLSGPCITCWTSILALLLVFVHAYFSHGVSKANAIDKDVALHFSRTMQEMLELPFDEPLRTRISAHPNASGWTQWSQLAQIAITALLAAAVVLIVNVRTS